MRYRRVLLVLFAVLLMKTTLLHANEINRVEQVISEAFQPAFTTFKVDAEALLESLTESCQSDKTKKMYQNASNSFSSIEIVQLGQLLRENRLERLFYWPDRKSIGQRQLRQLRGDPKLESLSLPALKEKSVALQGFPALGRLLFQSAPLLEAECHFAEVLARNIYTMAGSCMSAGTLNTV